MRAPRHFLRKQFLVSCAALTLGIGSAGNIVRADLKTTSSPGFFSFSTTSGTLKCNPASLYFERVAAGTSKVASATLSNAGSTNLTIYAVSSNLPAFSLNGLSLPLTLSPKQKISLQVTFAPQAAGHVGGSFSITSDASSTPVYLSVHGTGVASGTVSASPTTISFGNVQVGRTVAYPEVLTNSGAAPLRINQISVTGSGFSVSGASLPLSLAAGQSVTLSVAFNPQLAGQASGNLSISSNASNPTLMIPLTGSSATPGVLSASAASMSFGSVQVGSSQSLPGTLTNSGGSSLTISQANLTGAGFKVSGLTLPLTLAPGQAANFAVGFNPQSAGTTSGSLTFNSDASNSPLTVALSGSSTAPGVLSASSASMSFGSLPLGNNSTQSETLTNSGGSSVVVSQVSVTGSGFSTNGLSLPLTLVSGQSFTFGVSFAPTSAGSASGAITVASNATNPSLSISVSGNGAAAAPHSVNLSWNPSTSPVAGYNVYRGAQPGGPYTKLNPGVSASTTYNDSSVQTGQNYFYVTTAVSSNGMESGYSNEVQTAIPGTGGLPGVLAATASSLSFGSVQVGSSQALSETFTNSGGANLTISQANVSGAGFSARGLTLPLTLTPGQSFTFSAVFTPTSAGNASGNLTVKSNASDVTLAVPLAGSGTAAGQLAIVPSTLAFGSVLVGQSKSLTAMLNASGSNITISSATANTPEFALRGASFPLILTAGQSVALTVTFTPQASGAASDSLSLLSNASNSPAVESLSGSGTVAAQHSVTLSWTDTSSGIAGYNVYRATTSGGPFSKINTALNSTTAYTDNSVQAGQTYYYATTAVDGNGAESRYSSQAQAVIPAP
jgi:hypothetical protein